MKIKQATKQGYIECPIGGVMSVAYPESELRRGRVIDGGTITPTVECNSDIGVLMQDSVDIKNIKIRRLTPRECFRLQGFPDEMFDRAEQVSADGQLYKQAGNSVTVNVIYEIAKRLKEQK